MVGSDEWRWTEAVPTLPSDFEPSGKRRTSSFEVERGNIRVGLRPALVGLKLEGGYVGGWEFILLL